MLADERSEAELYRSLAGRRKGEDREILLGIADAEVRHAEHWERLLGDDVGRPQRGSLRTRVLIALARRFGSVFVLALVQQAESRTPYAADLDATRAMAADERVHEEVVRGLAARGRARVSGTFRAAVFGANDGLVSNLALVLGVSGGGVAAGGRGGGEGAARDRGARGGSQTPTSSRSSARSRPSTASPARWQSGCATSPRLSRRTTTATPRASGARPPTAPTSAGASPRCRASAR